MYSSSSLELSVLREYWDKDGNHTHKGPMLTNTSCEPGSVHTGNAKRACKNNPITNAGFMLN